MYALLSLLDTVINIYIWLLIFYVALTWLVQFNIVNTQNRIVYMVGDVLYRITEPALKHIRRVVPNLGGIDVSPVILILGLWFVHNLLIHDIAPSML